jgi:hypothetical protein
MASHDTDEYPEMTHGLWKHFKGGLYESKRVERDADTGGFRVSYKSLTNGTYHSRRIEQWNEVVPWPDGVERPRFILFKPYT